MGLIGSALYHCSTHDNYYFFEENFSPNEMSSNIKKISNHIKTDTENKQHFNCVGRVTDVKCFIDYIYSNDTSIKCNYLNDGQLKFLFQFDTDFEFIATNFGFGQIEYGESNSILVVQIMGYSKTPEDKYSYYGIDLYKPRAIINEFKPSENCEGEIGFSGKAKVTLPVHEFKITPDFEKIFNPSTSSTEACYGVFFNPNLFNKYQTEAMIAISHAFQHEAFEMRNDINKFLDSIYNANMPIRYIS